MIWKSNGSGRWLFVLVSLLLCQFGYAQTNIVKLSRIKDFINAGLTYIILSSDSLRKDSNKNWPEIDTVFQSNTLETPFYFAAMQNFLQGKFDSVTNKFSSRVDQIDINKYVQLNEAQAMQAIYDSAFLTAAEFSFLSPAAKDSIYSVLTQKGVKHSLESTSSIDTVAKPKTTQSPAPSYVPWYGKFRGFLFWLLVCMLISVGLFLYCLDQIRQLKAKLAESEKRVPEVPEEKADVATQHTPVTTVYAEFRNLVTEKITELYEVMGHLNHRVVILEKEKLQSPALNESIPIADDLIEKNDNIFYMSLPSPGYFPFSSRSLKKDALYKFILNGTRTEAHYEVINDGIFIGDALRDIEKFFEPACEPENEAQGEVRVVITKSPGVALFDGEKWMIQKKAVIIFI